MNIEWIIKIIQDNWPMFLNGAWVTLYISIIGTIIGTGIGLLIGLVKTIPMPEKGSKRITLKISNVRGGIISIDKGQFEAAQAIGMTHTQTMMNVVFPQVIRNILPATGNEFVINIKDTSVLNVISVSELYFATKTVAGANFRYFETFFVTLILYFIMTTVLTQILRYIERRMDGPDNYEIIHSDPLNSNSMASVYEKTKGKG